MKKRSSKARGFTLIEIMTVVSIVAILASLAIPELGARLRRAKRAEADIAMAKIEVSVRNYFNDKGRFPVAAAYTGTANSTMTGAWNPAVTGTNARFDPKATGWVDLEVPLDGVSRNFSYQLAGTQTGSAVTWTLTLRSDLDGDGLIALRTRTWTLSRNVWLLSSDVMSGDNEY